QGILLHSLDGSGITGCVLIDQTAQNFPSYEANGEPRRWWVVLAEDGTSLGDAAVLLAQMAVNGKIVPGTWVLAGSTLTWTPEPTGWIPPGMRTIGRPCVPLPDGYSFAVVSDGGLPLDMVVGPASAKPTPQQLAAQIIELARQI
ncbi:MAG TPA: hypothetical protein VJQ82_02590, partial [Terriglobales bacterium]|nr:hypothetical protein [Terriglobales bacterium]